MAAYNSIGYLPEDTETDSTNNGGSNGNGGWFDKVLDFIEVGTKGASDIISANKGNNPYNSPYQNGGYPPVYNPPKNEALPTWAIVLMAVLGVGFLFLLLKNKK